MKTTPVMLALDKTRNLAAILLLTLCSAHAFAQKITSDFDKATDFSTFKTYAWAPGTASPYHNLDLYIQMVVDEAFSKKGMRRVDPKEADLLVAYFAAGDTEVSMGGFTDPTFTATGGVPINGTTMWSSGVAVGAVGSSIRKGSLAIEMYDRRQQKMVWQAAAKDTMKEKMAERTAQLDKALVKMMDRYPPAKK
jgi:hypothetical protein